VGFLVNYENYFCADPRYSAGAFFCSCCFLFFDLVWDDFCLPQMSQNSADYFCADPRYSAGAFFVRVAFYFLI
jgi:hypothetical protein